MTLTIAARGASPADRAGAALVCDGKADVAVPAKALAGRFDEVALTAGTFDANAGHVPDGPRRLRIPGGATLRGAGPGLTRLIAEREPFRIVADAPGATVANLGGYGYVGLEVHADRFTAEDVYLTHSLDGRTYLPFGRKGGCTAASMARGRKGRTLRDLTFRRCSAEMSYHHGFGLNFAGASEGRASPLSSTTSATWRRGRSRSGGCSERHPPKRGSTGICEPRLPPLVALHRDR